MRDVSAERQPLSGLVDTPKPPYVAVIISTVLTDEDPEGHDKMAEAMYRLVLDQPGYLGEESACGDICLSISYWTDTRAAENWKQVAAHRKAQQLGQDRWLADYRVRVSVVERDYSKT